MASIAELRSGIGRGLVEVRRAAGLSQQEAAERAGVSARSFREYEAGRAALKVEVLLRFLSGVGGSLSAFETYMRADGGSQAPLSALREELRGLVGKNRRSLR